jgi:probable phosphoglycerate mutase
MTDLMFIRHAPTPWNRAKRLQGRSNIALDQAGRAVAASWRPAAQAWAGWPVIASPLQRAKETAALLFPHHAITLETRLAEMDFGSWEGKTLRDLRATPGGDAAQRELLGLDFHAPGGETPRQVQQRLRPLLQEIADAGRDTVAVAHKGVLRALYALAVDWDMCVRPPEKIHANCAHHFRLDAKGQPRVVQMNLPLLPRQPDLGQDSTAADTEISGSRANHSGIDRT